MIRCLAIFRNRYTVNTTLTHGRNWQYLDSDGRVQLAADLLSLEQPAIGTARAMMLARWLIDIERRHGRAGFALDVARRIMARQEA